MTTTQTSPSASASVTWPRRALHRRLQALALLIVTIPVGIVWRMAPLHLPPFAFKYGGSMLWATAVYWALAILLPRWRPLPLGLLTALVALGVELFKLAHQPELDAFRETLAGKLLLGKFFTVGAIVAYWLAIVLAAWADATFFPAPSQEG